MPDTPEEEQGGFTDSSDANPKAESQRQETDTHGPYTLGRELAGFTGDSSGNPEPAGGEPRRQKRKSQGTKSEIPENAQQKDHAIIEKKTSPN